MKRVLITGCGDVGTALGLRLRKQDVEVWGLRRRVDLLPRTFRPVQADLHLPLDLGILPRELDTVFFIVTADTFSEESYRRTYVEGLRHLVRALEKGGHRVQRLVFASSTSVYGQQDGSWVDENSPTEPAHFSGRCMLEAEGVLASTAWRSVALRSGGIYGPGRSKLMDRVRAGRESLREGPPRYVNLIHREDLVGALDHVARLAEPAPCYVAVDHEPVDRNELLGWLASALEVGPLPIERARSHDRSDRSNKRCRNDRLLKSGFHFRFANYRAGYQALMRLPSPHDDFYNYRPLAGWEGVVRYYGALSGKRGYTAARPLFDFVKQLSTSCLSVACHPSIVDDVLFVGPKPLQSNPAGEARVSIEMTGYGEVLFRAYPAGSEECSEFKVPRAAALDVLSRVLEQL